MVAWSLASSWGAAGNGATPQPEAEQVISAALKKLYMAAAAAAPQSPAQRQVILQMAEKASNESHVRSIVTAKMMELGTLDQLIEYATQYSVNPESARPFVQRMFQLGDRNSDPRVWNGIRLAAYHLKVSDLERQAQARGNQLAGR